MTSWKDWKDWKDWKYWQRRPLLLALAGVGTALVLACLACALTVTVLWQAGIRPGTHRYKAEGPGMEPTIRGGQILVVEAYGSVSPRRGDIVVFQAPPEALAKCPPSGDSSQINPDFVKRIIGLPGDTVQIRPDGGILLDGTQLNEPYINPGPNFQEMDTWHLDSRQYFVMGDNRGDSCDSRAFGPIGRSSIDGKVVSII